MRKVQKMICLVLTAALVIGFLPAKKASAASDLPASLTAATSTTATVTWNINAVLEELKTWGDPLVGFELWHWNLTDLQDVKVATVSAQTSTYTYRNMNPSREYLLTIKAIARSDDGAYYTIMSNNINYVPSRYNTTSGGGGNSQITPGGGGNSGITALRTTVASTAITGIRYMNQGFGKSKGLSVTWKGYTDITGYRANLYNRKGKLVESKTISNPYINYCTFNKANSKNVYFVKVRFYYTYGGVTTWSKDSADFRAVPQAKITSNKKCIKRHSIKLKWKKVSGATGYTVYARKGGKKKWTKVKTLKSKSSSYTFKKFKKKRITVNAAGWDLKVRTTGKVKGKKVNSTSYYYTNFYLI